MTRAPILLIGAGGHARACVDVIELEGRYEVVGLLGLPDEVGSVVLGYPVLGDNAHLPALASSVGCAIVSVGQIRTPQVRIELFDALQRAGCALPTIVSPLAYVSRHASIGAGTIVMHGALVNAGAIVGRNCILNSRSLVEHDAVVADHCHVATAAALNGGVRLGTGTFVGSGASVREGITLGERCVIGMGQVVLADCGDGERLPRRRSA